MPDADLKHAIDVILRGGTVVFPTETQYALGALATDKEAIGKIYAIKRRPGEKLLPVIVGSMAQAQKYFFLTRNEQVLAKKFWPGPLSMVLRTRSKKIAEAIGSDRLAVRYSADRIAAALALRAGAPVVSTSANTSGKLPCYTVAAVKRQLSTAPAPRCDPDTFLDGGPLKKSLPSTIIEIKNGHFVILREGKIPTQAIGKYVPPTLGQVE